VRFFVSGEAVRACKRKHARRRYIGLQSLHATGHDAITQTAGSKNCQSRHARVTAKDRNTDDCAPRMSPYTPTNIATASLAPVCSACLEFHPHPTPPVVYTVLSFAGSMRVISYSTLVRVLHLSRVLVLHVSAHHTFRNMKTAHLTDFSRFLTAMQWPQIVKCHHFSLKSMYYNLTLMLTPSHCHKRKSIIYWTEW